MKNPLGTMSVKKTDTSSASYVIERRYGPSRLAIVAAWLQLLIVLCAFTAHAAGLPDGRYALTLAQNGGNGPAAATATGAEEDDTPANSSASLNIVLERAGGQWVPLFAGLGPTRLFGLIEQADETGNVRAQILADAMGRSNNLFKYPEATSLTAYALALRAGADGKVTGSWSSPAGTGALTGAVQPLPATGRAPAVGEHPRFLLRADQLAALKAKAATPWGQSLVKHLDKDTWSRSGRAVGLGLLYRLTGDKAFAQRAQELVLADIRAGFWDVIGPIHDPPHKIMEAVYTWDLIHDAASAEFQRELLARLRDQLRFQDNFCNIDRGNGHPYSNWSAQFQTGVGMAALALLGQPSSHQEPAPATDIPTVPAPTDSLPVGVPVFPVDADAKQLSQWLVAGPFDIGVGNDGLAELGGVARAKPADGLKFPLKVKATESAEVNDKPGLHLIQMKNMKFKWGDIRGDDLQPLTKASEGVFRPVPADWVCKPNTYGGAPGYVDLREASGYRSWRTFYFAAAIKVPAPTIVRLDFQNQQRVDPCVYIAGRMFRVNDLVRLEAGTYPVLLPVTYTTFIGSHGRNEAVFAGFRLAPVTPEQEAKVTGHRATVAAFHALVTKAGHADYWPRLWLASARLRMDLWVTHAMSERGWNIAGDCYTLPSLQALGPFAHAHANATGAALGSPGHLDWVLPHQVAKTVFAADRAFAPAYGRGGGPWGPMPYARCFGFVAPALQPAVGWAAHRTLELALAGKLTSENLVVDELDPASAAFALVHWPTPDQVKPPQGILPITIADRQRCAWIWRNRYQDGEDAVAMIAGFIHPGGDWGDVVSGEWRLSALGHDWAMRGGGAGAPGKAIPYHNTVFPAMQPDGKTTVWRQPLYREADGSAAGAPGAVRLQMHAMGTNGDAGPVIGSRFFLADFSGACGAPVLVVLSDRAPPAPPPPPKKEDDFLNLDNSDKDLGDNADLLGSVGKPAKPPTFAERNQHLHRWMMVTDPAHTVTVRPDGFTLTAKDGTTLVATVLSPAKPLISHEPADIGMELNYRHDHRNGKTPRTAIQVAGDGSFLVAMTVQKGQAPKVTLAGDRLSIGDMRLRIGEDGIHP